MLFSRFFKKSKEKRMEEKREIFKQKNKIINETFQKVFNLGNETEKALICKEYLRKSSQTNSDLIGKIFHMISNESMTNRVFSNKIIEIGLIPQMFSKCYTSRNKWLMYSAFWNLFRYEENRNISDNMINKIIIDCKYIFTINENRLYNTYFGCISNLCLNIDCKPKFGQLIKSINSLEEIEKLETILDFDNENCTSLFGLMANLAVDDEIVEDIIDCSVLHSIFKKFNGKYVNTYKRNFLAMMSNLSTNKSFIKMFIKYKLIEQISNDDNDITNGLYQNILTTLNIPNNKTTSLHLANSNNFIDIIYEIIKNEEYNINVIDYQGNTVLHHALQNEKYSLAKFYIHCNANINQLNKKNESPLTLKKDFVNKIVRDKDKIKSSYLSNINIRFDEHKFPMYETNLCNIVESFIDKTDDAFNVYINDMMDSEE